MMVRSRITLLGALCFGLAACTTTESGLPAVDPTLMDDADLFSVDLPAVRAMAPQGHPFVQGLRQGYLDLSQSLSDAGDGDSRHFARKAAASAKGLNVQPDMLTLRRIAQETSGELTAARARMIAAFDGGGRRVAPADAATAQVSFDCWLERVEAGDAAGAAKCKAAFEDAIGKVERALGPGAANVYIVFFAWDRSDVTPVAQEILKQVAEDYRAGRRARIALAGHADRSGPEAYNQGLSERRARSIAAALTRLGVPSEALVLNWYGETRPRVQTPDGVREPQNRRVEITFE